MADTDVIGIVSLLLAAGGAAYLFRARIVAQRAEAEAAALEAEEAKKGASAGRNEKTLPPTRRPASEPPPKPAKATVPQTPEAKAEATEAKRDKLREAKETKISRTDPLVKPPEGESSKAAPEKKPEPSKAEEKKPEPSKAAPETKPEPSSKAAPETKPEAATAEAPKPAESKPAEAKPKAAESKPKAEAPKPAESKPKAVAPPKPIEKKPAEKKPEEKKSVVTTPDKKSFKKQTIVGLPEPANAPSMGPPKSPAVDKLPELPQVDIPRLDTDEDEDVEPTRVGRMVRQSIRPPVEKHVFDAGAETMDFRKSRPLELVVYALAQTDPGRRRKNNEDSFLVREKLGVYVVADGMGGHKGGEFASKCAVDTIANAFETKKFDAEAHADIPREASELARAIQMANSAILEEAAKKPELKGMGTTLCAARFTDDHRRLFLGHVGDSRCYRIRNGTMIQMTKDHTMADYGIAGPEGSHLSRALGVWPTVPIDVIMATPELNDVYLLCSDGLTKMLKDETIAAQLLHEEDPKTAVQRLVMFANAHGGKDNITVILLRVVEPGWKPPSERAPSS
ncbi:MAG: protein phosphatase 2C domain-containing protein [Labilithrix sp.]